MTGVARIGDMVECVCYSTDHVIPVSTVGFFVSGDTTNLTNGSPTVRVGDVAECLCGHSTVVIAGSVNHFSSGLAVARVGDAVFVPNGPVGVITTGSSDCFNADVISPPRQIPAEVAAVIPPENIQPTATLYDAVTYTIIEDIGDPMQQDFSLPPPQRPRKEVEAIAFVGVVHETSTPIATEEVRVAPPAPPPVSVGPISVDCKLIPANPQSNMRLSENYNLASLSTHTAVSNYPVRDQTANGIYYSKQQIVCNLSKLATHLLEPIGKQFGKPLITSAFRHGTNASNHNKGCAADIQWPELSGNEKEYFDRINWIKDNLIWNELVLEYGGRAGPWLHVSYMDYGPKANNRYNFKTLKSLAGNGIYEMGVFKLYKNVPGVGGR